MKSKVTLESIGSYLHQNLHHLLANKKVILENKDYYFINLPQVSFEHLVYRFKCSPYLGGLITLWNEGYYLLSCEECKAGKIHGFHYSFCLLHTDEQGKEVRRSQFHGVCDHCKKYVVYIFDEEERFSLPQMNLCISSAKNLDKQSSSATHSSDIDFETLPALLGETEDIPVSVKPIIYNKGKLSPDEISQKKNHYYREYIKLHMGFTARTAFQNWSQNLQETYIRDKILEINF